MSRYFYPNDRRDPDGAIPVYIVPAPTPGPPWPSKQNNGAIPINMMPVGTLPNAGPIPVRVVAGTGPGPSWPSDQGQDAGAIPCYNSANGMPVWDATGAPPLPPPIITSLSFTNTVPFISDIEPLGNMTATNGPIEWSLGANATPYTFIISRISGQIVITDGLSVVPGTVQINVIATNSSGFDVQPIRLIFEL
jgi:hypothetical protein